MRQVESGQCTLGGTFISESILNPKPRDDIQALLIGLQHLYTNKKPRNQVFALLEAEVNSKARKDSHGRVWFFGEFPSGNRFSFNLIAD